MHDVHMCGYFSFTLIIGLHKWRLLTFQNGATLNFLGYLLVP